jgi:hypothetical protein
MWNENLSLIAQNGFMQDEHNFFLFLISNKFIEKPVQKPSILDVYKLAQKEQESKNSSILEKLNKPEPPSNQINNKRIEAS